MCWFTPPLTYLRLHKWIASKMIHRETVNMPRPINTKWKKIRELGSGGQGSTFLVRNREDPEEDKRVLKELNRPENETALRRFENEIETIIGIDHPSIIKIIEYSIWHDPPFYVMEYHEGARTLADVIITEDRFANPFYGDTLMCLDLFEKIIRAIRVCEFQQPTVLYRDISPRNILLLESGDIILIDFGLARTIEDTQLTQSGENIGTRNYAAPECEAGNPNEITIMSDVYSATKVLFSAITSRYAFAQQRPVFDNWSMEKLFPNKEETWHLNRIFNSTIRNDPENRTLNTELMLLQIEEIQRLVKMGFPPLEGVIKYCPSCGRRTVEKFRVNPQYMGVTLSKEYTLYECKICGHVSIRKPHKLLENTKKPDEL